MFFHWRYLFEASKEQARIGTYVLELSQPERAAEISQAVDALFDNSADRTKTETERAFQAGFVSMYGNLPFLLGVIGLAVVFAILLVAANAMMMTFRERTREIGVMKTLGFTDREVFGLVLAEAAVVTLGGGAIGSLSAKVLIEGSGFNFGGFLPPMSVHWSTVAQGLGIAAFIGAISGLVPAALALRLRIVDALRRT
jgi:putative ABC transport system permease protein